MYKFSFGIRQAFISRFVFVIIFFFEAAEEMCVNGRCECLQGSDGNCVTYPITCSSSVLDNSTNNRCQDSLKGSVCDKVTNW